MHSSAHAVDNYLQGELFDSNLLAMPTTKTLSSGVNKSRDSETRSREVERLPNGRAAKVAKHGKPNDQIALGLDLKSDPPVRVVKSKRRKRHIAAYRQSGEIVISVPFRTTRAEITALIPELVARVIAGEERERTSERELEERARMLMKSHLPEVATRPASITWRPMQERWGSCTTVDRTIRISERLHTAPEYVIDYVLFHELIHLEIPGHGEDFHRLLHRYPEVARAEAFLEGFEAGERGS
jgi:predicted metal-dependent hydrolase